MALFYLTIVFNILISFKFLRKPISQISSTFLWREIIKLIISGDSHSRRTNSALEYIHTNIFMHMDVYI